MDDLRAASSDDPARLAAVDATGLMDTPPDSSFDQITDLVAALLGLRWSFLTIVDDRRSFWKSAFGVVGIRQSEIAKSFCQYVIEDDGPFSVSDARTDARTMHNPAVESMGVVAWAGHPLRDRAGHVLGTLCAVDDHPRQWAATDLQLLATLAAGASTEIQLRAALAASNRLAGELQDELKVRDRMVERANHLAELAHGLAVATTTTEVSSTITRLGAAALAATFANVAVVEEGGTRIRVDHARGLPSGMAERYATLPLGENTPLSDSITHGQPVLLQNLAEVEARYAHLVDDTCAAGLQATASLPLRRADGTIVGAFGVGWSTPIQFTPMVLSIIKTVAEMCSQALDRSILGDARSRFLRSLQDALLGTVPMIQGLDIEAMYLPANNQLGFGGDWYDVIPLSPSRTAIIVGDVCGHGLDAAATMTQIRGAVNALVRLNCDRLETLFDDVEKSLGRPDCDFIATASVHIVDTQAHEVVYISAGHPPGLLIDSFGQRTLLEGGRRPVLGLGGRPVIVGRASFEPGTLLIAYTDGLIEQGRTHIDVGIDRISKLALAVRDNDLGDIANQLARSIAHAADDVVFTLVRHRPE
ncbi:MAG: SpoIIE family protein phosphatase [Ilumatobacteraceae bacterium]